MPFLFAQYSPILVASLLCYMVSVCADFMRKISSYEFQMGYSLRFIFSAGFAWNAHYSEKRLENILAENLENQELLIEGRVVSLPQGDFKGAKFALRSMIFF